MYGYVAPNSKTLKYKVAHKLPEELLAIPQIVFSNCPSPAPRVYSELVAKHSDPRRTCMTVAIRLYIYYLQHPQQFAYSTDNIMPHIYQSIKRTTLSLIQTVKVTCPKYIRLPNKFILSNMEYLSSLLHNHITTDPIYKDLIKETCVKRLTSKEMITKYLRTNSPTQLPDSHGWYLDYNILRSPYGIHKGY